MRKSKGAKSRATKIEQSSVNAVVADIRNLIHSARDTATRSVNTIQVITNFQIGRRIVEHEQRGANRAAYGKQLLTELSSRLTEEFGRGFSQRNLKYMRSFYLEYRKRKVGIARTESAQLSRKLPKTQNNFDNDKEISAQLAHNSLVSKAFTIRQIESGELPRNSSLYERLALSRDKTAVRTLAKSGQQVSAPGDLLKDHYVLEFLGLEEKSQYSETDLESAIISKLETFLLELGKGFLFEARQKRFTLDGDHFFVDLVFYNRLLRCYVLVDLKLGKLSHQDLGQMQMYVNHFDRFIKEADEAQTVGIVLCKMKSDALVEITLPKASNITAARYQLYLPDKETLKRELMRL